MFQKYIPLFKGSCCKNTIAWKTEFIENAKLLLIKFYLLLLKFLEQADLEARAWHFQDLESNKVHVLTLRLQWNQYSSKDLAYLNDKKEKVKINYQAQNVQIIYQLKHYFYYIKHYLSIYLAQNWQIRQLQSKKRCTNNCSLTKALLCYSIIINLYLVSFYGLINES